MQKTDGFDSTSFNIEITFKYFKYYVDKYL